LEGDVVLDVVFLATANRINSRNQPLGHGLDENARALHHKFTLNRPYALASR